MLCDGGEGQKRGTMATIEITETAVRYMSDITGNEDQQEAEEFLQTAIGLCRISDTDLKKAEQVSQLIESALGLIEYRKSAGPLNFQLEKADTFIFRIRVALEAMGVIQLPPKPKN